MNQSKYIEELLKKYWDAETSLLEEKELQEYFEGENIPTEFVGFKPLFIAKTKYQNIGLSEDFEAKLFAKLESTDKVITMKNETLTQSEPTVVISQSAEIRKLRWIAGIAASIALILAVYIVMPSDSLDGFAYNESSLTESEREEALKAYQQTKSALLFVSEKMNYGVTKAAEGLNKVPNLGQTIREIE